MTYQEFIKLHRIPDKAILKLLWDVSEAWQKGAGRLPPGMRHALLSTFEVGGRPILDSPIEEKRARKWLVANGYKKHQPKKRQKITQAKAAKWIGVSEKTIRRWGNGEHTPTDYPSRDDRSALEAFAKKYREET